MLNKTPFVLPFGSVFQRFFKGLNYKLKEVKAKVQEKEQHTETKNLTLVVTN